MEEIEFREKVAVEEYGFSGPDEEAKGVVPKDVVAKVGYVAVTRPYNPETDGPFSGV